MLLVSAARGRLGCLTVAGIAVIGALAAAWTVVFADVQFQKRLVCVTESAERAGR
jgi:hypothetical protein